MLEFIYYAIFIILLMGANIIDWKIKEVPDGISLLGILIAINYNLFFGDVKTSIIGGTLGILFVAMLNWSGVQRLGGGDSKLAGMVGAFTNWMIIFAVLVVAYVISRIPLKKDREIAYTPYMTLALMSIGIVAVGIKLCLNVISYLRT